MYEELAKTPHLRTSDKLFGHPVWSLLGGYVGLVGGAFNKYVVGHCPYVSVSASVLKACDWVPATNSIKLLYIVSIKRIMYIVSAFYKIYGTSLAC